jgi:hypothetical protein
MMRYTDRLIERSRRDRAPAIVTFDATDRRALEAAATSTADEPGVTVYRGGSGSTSWEVRMLRPDGVRELCDALNEMSDEEFAATDLDALPSFGGAPVEGALSWDANRLLVEASNDEDDPRRVRLRKR